jgi:rhomboid protease GluP
MKRLPLSKLPFNWILRMLLLLFGCISAQLKAAADNTLEMKRVAASIDLNQWPAVILQLFLGDATSERVKEATDADRRRRSVRECQAVFYLGVFDLEKGDKTGAVDRFQAARDSCPSTSIEFAAAKAELMHLQSK